MTSDLAMLHGLIMTSEAEAHARYGELTHLVQMSQGIEDRSDIPLTSSSTGRAIEQLKQHLQEVLRLLDESVTEVTYLHDALCAALEAQHTDL